ncbi:hypothetical protein BAE44_0022673 [Dichanthelium oligosanthes]|uniref:AN1-type domain-containing protein n=1 Tax=Dichanthelium oligosanthes TaxID=888268 RepID=A0A1E5UU18_9POAL|nr:hypothetical protein BAE44_0022673 [Dichanthelium oligosanthes]
MCSIYHKKHYPVNGEPGANSSATTTSSRSAVVAAALDVCATVSSAATKPTVGVSFTPAAKATTTAGVAEAAATMPLSSAPGAAKKVQPVRCVACYKKTGLTGFVCRCGKTFCGSAGHTATRRSMAVASTSRPPAATPSLATTRSSRERSFPERSEYLIGHRAWF